MTPTMRRLLRHDAGNELMEYAFLAALVGLAGYVVVTGFVPTMETVYTSWGAEVMRLWEPPSPK